MTTAVLPAHAQQAPAPSPSSLPKTEIVGRLGGDDVAVKNGMDFEAQNGRSTAMVANGTDITVRSGQAKIDLLEGGDIEICGPAHLSILKSGGAVTIALDYGMVHLQLGATPAVMLYMPLIVATPVAIGSGARDLTIGLDRQGKLCVGALAGAVRLEQQMTSQSLLIPQGGRMRLMSTELSPLGALASGECSCELMVSQSSSPTNVELSVPVRPPAMAAARNSIPPETPARERAVYRIDMPPLSFNANSPSPPADPDMAAMLLVRESSPEPDVIFKGVVEPAVAEPAAIKQEIAMTQPLDVPARKPGFFARIFGFFHW